MKWPRGKYNGQRIVGFRVHVNLNVLRWRFVMPDRFSPRVILGPLWIGLEWNYEQR